MNTARSALSALTLHSSTKIGSHKLVIHFMKGIYNLRPSQPRYNVIWDVSILTKHLVSQFPLEDISFAHLTHKVAILIAITSSARCEMLVKLCLENAVEYPDRIIFKIPQLIKQSRPGYVNPIVNVQSYPGDPRKCPFTTLKHYLSVTKKFRQFPHQGQLFLATQKPFLPVTSNTISNWIKKSLASAGVDTSIFTSHSTRSASSSKLHQKGIPVEFILQNAGWSNEKTFAKHYKKEIIVERNIPSTLL